LKIIAATLLLAFAVLCTCTGAYVWIDGALGMLARHYAGEP
jgi:hypothetical protein